MAQKVIIIGSTGMLGHQVLDFFLEQKDFEIQDIVFRKKRREESIVCDVTDFTKIQEIINDISPDYIVNCVGVLIKGSKTSPSNAIKINSFFPHFLVDISEKIGCKVIHISTDCVFSGKDGNYVESSFRDADDIYGRSKALGEIISNNHLTLRTSIIGPELKENGEGLLHWYLTNNEKMVLGYKNVLWGGVTTYELTKAIHFSIINDLNGIWNLTNNKSLSKNDLLGLFNARVNPTFKKVINQDNSKISNKSLMSERSIDYQVPNYSQMINEMFERMKINHDDYPHYKGAM